MWPFRGSPKPSADNPDIQCHYCRNMHKWRMDIWRVVRYVCEKHVDLALDEYIEIGRGNGKVPAA